MAQGEATRYVAICEVQRDGEIAMSSRAPHCTVWLPSFLVLLLTLAAAAQSAENPYDGKVAVITGSSSGLGAELAKIAADKTM